MAILLTDEDVSFLKDYLSFRDKETLLQTVQRGGTIGLKGAVSQVYVKLTEEQKRRITTAGENQDKPPMKILQEAIQRAIDVEFGYY